jgi:hypothetical protein
MRNVCAKNQINKKYTGSREVRLEDHGVCTVVAFAVTVSNTIIAGGEQDGATTGTKLCKQIANVDSIIIWHSLLVIAIGCAERLWDGGCIEDVVEPVNNYQTPKK